MLSLLASIEAPLQFQPFFARCVGHVTLEWNLLRFVDRAALILRVARGEAPFNERLAPFCFPAFPADDCARFPPVRRSEPESTLTAPR